MKKMLTYVRPLAVFLLFDFAAPAQSPQQNWAAVQGLPVGTEVRVALNAGHSAASIVTRIPTASETTIVRVAKTVPA